MESMAWTTVTGVDACAGTPLATDGSAGPRRVAAIQGPLGGGVRPRPVIGTRTADVDRRSAALAATRSAVRLGSADAFTPIPGHAPGGHPA